MDLQIIIDRPGLKTIIEKFLIEKLSEDSIQIEIIIEEEKQKSKPQLVKDSSIFKFKVSSEFVITHYSNRTKGYLELLEKFEEIFQSISKKNDEIIRQFKTFSAVSVVHQHDKVLLHFPFKFLTKDYISAFESALQEILSLNHNLNFELKQKIKNTFDEGEGGRFFKYENEKWEVIDPLIVMTDSLNSDYKVKRDSRVHKPHIIVNQSNIFKYFIFDRNWVLAFDGLETLMTRPNDVSLYSNIADKNLKGAEEFYKEKILPRHENYYGSFPSINEQTQYFDYFELIIQAVIFSYTALEAFANICIPVNFEYVIEKNDIKTIYGKQAIERNFSLRDKFKIILPEILNTTDVSLTKWWSTFIELENLRNEIVHSKPSKSEDRYSALLEKRVFKLIKIHKMVIKYFGNYILQNKRSLLEEFPYNMGRDEVYPGLMTEKNYNQAHRNMHNIKV